MQPVSSLKGVIVPIVTPMRSNEEVDTKGLERLVQYMNAGGVQGLLVLGSCGEFASLSFAQRLEVVDTVVRANKGQAVITVGTADSSLKHVLDFTEKVSELGADAAVVTTPFYFHLSREETVAFYKSLSQETQLPIIAYNIPKFTANPIPPEVVSQISRLDNIVGLKDTGENFADFFTILQQRTDSDFRVYMGDEGNIVPGLSAGADGFVPSVGNFAPGLCVQLYDAATGDNEAWQPLWNRFVSLKRVYGSGMWIKGLKAALKVLGICDEYLAPPFGCADAAQLKHVEQVLIQAGVLN